MKNTFVENVIASSYSIVLHIVLVVLFFVGMERSSTPTIVAQPKVDIVQASVIDESQVLEQMARLQQIEDKKRQQEKDRQAKIDKKLEETQQELARKEQEYLDQQERAKIDKQQRDLKVQQEKEQIKKLEKERKLEDEKRLKAQVDRKIEEELKKKAEQERLVEEELKQKAAEDRRIAEEKKRLAEADRKAEEDRKRKAEQDRKKAEELKRKAEEQRKAEEIRKKKAEEEAQRAEADNLLQQSLAAEEREREERRINGVVNQHVSIIRQRVKRYWIRPTNTEGGLQTILRVNLIPTGDVQKVVVVKSSGNAIFDRSAESAVYKAAPFAMPTDRKAAAELRDFQFIFKPE